MERTAEQIKAKMKEYKDKPEAMEAMTDMLLFMGIADAPLLYKEAVEELQQEKSYTTDLRAAYYTYIGQGARYYMPFEEFVWGYERGDIKL